MEPSSEIVKQLPIKELYQDALQPAISEAGKALQGVVKIALSPVSAMIWGYEKIAAYLDVAIPECFAKRKIEREKIIAPDAAVAVPIIEAMRYTSHKEEIRSMFTNLLAAAMCVETKEDVHPSFIEIIKQMSSDEAKIISYMGVTEIEPIIGVIWAGEKGNFDAFSRFCLMGEKIGLVNKYELQKPIINLERLGLIRIPNRTLTEPEAYRPLEQHSFIQKFMKISAEAEANGFRRIRIDKEYIEITLFGEDFCKICCQ